MWEALLYVGKSKSSEDDELAARDIGSLETGQDEPPANGSSSTHLPVGGGRPVEQGYRRATVDLPSDSNPMAKAF